MAEEKAVTSVFAENHEPDDYNCSVCQEIFQTPVRTHNCQHVFCRKCLLMAIKATGAHCPLCRGALCRWEKSAPTRASDIEKKMRILSLGCTYCGKAVKLSYMRLHYKSCKSYQEEFGTAPKDSTLQNDPYATKSFDTVYKCPLCQQGNLNRKALLDHCNLRHYFEVAEAVCPICSALPCGDANHTTGNIVGHLNSRHQFNYEEFMPLQEHTEVDVDGGKDKDIFDINQGLDLNLFEGDIKLQPNERNSIIGNQYRWPIPVPYYLEDSLEINAKALVLEAFERYRLKSCIDFKPWEGEQNYISVFKESGCWSYVGNLRTGRQRLSLGPNCDRIATIQHEFLHALGFWHEQSRSDRDDYVIIMWDRIQSSSQSNFNKYNDTRSTALNVPYDYTSVMHYGKTAFQIVDEPTIVTRIEAFSDVIGQRMDFSDYDLEKLNRLYNCSTFISFLDTCDFEYNNICGMIQGTEDNNDWQHVPQMPDGPSTDHTNMGDCKDSGLFMHFSTKSLNTGDKALLESRFFYPKRGFQCLEFFYYHNGHESDKLNIWIREYTEAAPNGTLIFITTVNGQPAEYWQLYHVPLSINNKFRVVFEGVRGSGNSNGGISIDDINLSEAKCPHYIWHIRNFTNQLNSEQSVLFSPPYYSKDGYAFQVQLKANSTGAKLYDLGIYFHLISGENDNTLQWPCSLRQATMTLLDQNPDIRKRMLNLRSITTDPYYQTDNGQYFWDRPDRVGSNAIFPNGTQYFRTNGLGTSAYITNDRVLSRDFLKGGDAFLLLSVDDVTHLNTTQPVPPPTNATTTSGTGTTTSGTGTTTIGTGTTTSGTGTTTSGTGTTTSGTGTTTTKTPGSSGSDSCAEHGCQNDGVCIYEDNKPVCRCKITTDWWYVGDKCETKVSSQDTLVIAVASSVTIFVVMLIVTLVTAYCLKKKHKKQMKAARGEKDITQNTTGF